MTRLTRELAGRGRKAVRAAVDEVETRILAAEGRKAVRRKAVRRKARAVTAVTKAAKTGLVIGTLAGAGVVVREIRRRARD